MSSTSSTQVQEFEPVELPSQYLKAIVALVTAVLGVVVTALTDDVITQVEIIGILIALLTAVGVYVFPNIKDQHVLAWTKAVVAIVGTALQTLNVIVGSAGDISGVSTSEWLLVILSALGALGVGIVPNVDPKKKAIVEAQARVIAEERVYADVSTASADSPE